MVSYKLYEIFEKEKEETIKRIQTQYENASFFSNQELVAIPIADSPNAYQTILDTMYPLQVRQCIVSQIEAWSLIEHFGKQKYQIDITFSEPLRKDLESMIKGYFNRVATEELEVLRLSDLSHVISILRSLHYEDDIDILKMSFQLNEESFLVISTGVIELFSHEGIKYIKECSMVIS